MSRTSVLHLVLSGWLAAAATGVTLRAADPEPAWPQANGPFGNFNPRRFGVNLLDDLSLARQVWVSEFRDLGFAKGSSAGYAGHLALADTHPARRLYWQDVLQRWRRSGEAASTFCRNQGIRPSAFYFWRRTLAGQDQEARPATSLRKLAAKTERLPLPGRQAEAAEQAPPPFLPLRVVDRLPAGVDRPEPCGVEILLAQGHRVLLRPGFDRRTLAAALAVLEARSC